MAILILIALIALFSEPIETSATWLRDLIISKLIAIIAIIGAKYIYNRTKRYA